MIGPPSPRTSMPTCPRGTAVWRTRRWGRRAHRRRSGSGFTSGLCDAAPMRWSDDCVQLCLMVPRRRRSRASSRHCCSDPCTRGCASSSALGPQGAASPCVGSARSSCSWPRWTSRRDCEPFPASGRARALEGLVSDGLLLSVPHNYSDRLLEPANVLEGRHDLARRPPGRRPSWNSGPGRPGRPRASPGRCTWASGRSRRASTASWRPPARSAYLRRVRLRHGPRRARPRRRGCHHGAPAVATGLGFLHLGRFTAAYREAFGENPSGHPSSRRDRRVVTVAVEATVRRRTVAAGSRRRRRPLTWVGDSRSRDHDRSARHASRQAPEDVPLAWGDRLLPEAPALNRGRHSAKAAAGQVGTASTCSARCR